MSPSNPLSVVMVIQSYYPTIGGAEKQCLELSKRLKDRGVEVKVITERWKGLRLFEEIEGIPIRRLGWGGPRIWHSLLFMASTFLYLVVRARKYSIIHVHLAASHAVAATIAGKIFRKKVFVMIGGGNKVGEIALSRKTFSGRLKLLALGFLKPQFIILNQSQSEELHGFGLEKIPFKLIPNGVDMSRYRAVTLFEKSQLRDKLKWKGLVFLYTGRFSPDKIPLDIFENFLKGWSEAFKNKKVVELYFVGKGPLEKDYLDLIHKHGLQDDVHLWSARDNVSELYQAADVFVLPSASEGLSNSLLEAMASSLPVLASRVSGIAEIVREDVHGFLFDPFSPLEVTQCLTKIYREKEGLDSMGSNCWAVTLEYSMAKTVDQYVTLYQTEQQ